MTGVFTPTDSSNILWFDENMEDCLTLHIEGIEDDVAALQTGKANTIHTHSTYADLDHTHNNYALTTHTHNEYATTNHTHTGFAESNHTHSYNDLTDKPTIPTSLPANGGNADTVDGKHASDFADAAHTHTEITSKYEKPSTGIPKTDLASDVQSSLGKADTALQSYTETDPTVPAWAKAATKPTYTASEVGALSSDTILADLTDDATHRTVTDTEKAVWNAKSTFSGSYNDLTDKPTIPSTADFATVSYVDNKVAGKVDVVDGKGLSTNDYTDAEKTKLAGIETGANKTIVDSVFNMLSDNPVKNSVISAALAGKANLVHTHSDKADAEHTHDDRYYTESEIDTKLNNKVDVVSGKGLSTNDFTTAEKNKLAGIADITPVAKGGTGQTSRYTTVSITHQNAKTSSSTSCRYFPYLGMCWVRAYVVLNVALTAGTALTVIEVDGEYRPSSITALATHNNSANLSAYIRKNQTNETDPATIKIKSDTDLAAGSGIYISGWWTAV